MTVERLWLILRAKFARLVDRAEDPRETLDLVYEQQLSLLRHVRRGITEVVTAKKLVALTASKRRDQVATLEVQARQALAAGREDLARAALARRVEAERELRTLDAQVAELEAQQRTLADRERELGDRIARFRSGKEVIKAQYTTAEAMVQIGDAATGLGRGLADAGRAIARAREKTDGLQARALAIDELIATGTLTDALDDRTPVDRELAALVQSAAVAEDLERLKRELDAPSRRELTAGSPD